MPAAAERCDAGATGDPSGEGYRSLNGTGPAWAAELDLVVESSRLQHHGLERVEEITFGDGREIEPVNHPIGAEIRDQPVLDEVRVVPVVERTRAREEVDVHPAVLVVEQGALRAVEDGGEGATVGADVGFHPLEDVIGRRVHRTTRTSARLGSVALTGFPLARNAINKSTTSRLSRSPGITSGMPGG